LGLGQAQSSTTGIGNMSNNVSGANTPNKSPSVAIVSSLHGSASSLQSSTSASPSAGRIAKVCCGFQVTLVLMENSDVFIWGDGMIEFVFCSFCSFFSFIGPFILHL
jgi:hypothetical protein